MLNIGRSLIIENKFILFIVLFITFVLIVGNIYLSKKTMNVMSKSKAPYQITWLSQAIVLNTISQILLMIYLYSGFGRIYVNYMALLAQVYYLLFFTKFRIRDDRNHRKIIILLLYIYICVIIYFIFDDAYSIRNGSSTATFLISWVKAFRPMLLLSCPAMSCLYLIRSILKNNYRDTVKKEKIVVLFTTIFLIISVMDEYHFPLYFIIYQILSLWSNKLLIINVVKDKGRFLND